MRCHKIFWIGFLSMLVVASVASAQTATYQYGPSNQLLEARYADCTIVTYAYDANGNRTERIVQPCPAISGYVLTDKGDAIADVVLTGLPGDPQTDATGFYRVQVEPGWSGTVTPQKTDYTFTPVDRSYANLTADQTEQNYVGVLPQYTLTVKIVGSGTVTDDDGGINCDSECMKTFDKNTQVFLTAAPAAGFIFIGWSAAAECPGVSACSLPISADTTLTATFSPDPTNTPIPTVSPDITPTPSGKPTPMNPIPEPGTLILLSIGLLGLLRLGLRRRNLRK